MKLISEDYLALAEFRYQIRKFLVVSEQIARSAKLEPQQYMMLLALRGLPEEKEPNIIVLAERLQIKHNSAVELINRLAKRGLIRRSRSDSDSRKVLITLTAKGVSLIEKLVEQRFVQLQESQPELVRALHHVLARTNRKAGSKAEKKRGSSAFA
jgi:DNA-binding MarR family transcriptional regulator